MNECQETGPERQQVQRQQQTEITQRLEFVAERYEGPIPDPQTLDRYEKVHPGAIDWILEQAKDQGRHRRKLEKRIVNWGTFNEFLGVTSTFLISLVVIGGGIFLIFNGRGFGGLSIIIANLAALVISVYKAGQKRT